MGWGGMSAASKYAYLAPKAFYEKGLLLRREDYLSLVECRSLEALVSKLEETAYKQFLERVKGEITPELIESAAQKALATFLKKIVSAVPRGAPRELIETFRERLIVRELKAVVRTLLEGGSAREARERLDWSLIEELEAERFFETLLGFETMKEAVAYLKNLPYRDYLEEADASYQASRDPALYDMFLDKYIVERLIEALEALSGPDKVECQPLIGWEADLYNVYVAVRGRLRGLPLGVISKLIVRHGRVGREDLLSRLMTSESPLTELASTRIGAEAKELGIQRFTLETLEILYRRKMFQLAQRKFLGVPFHLGTALALAYMKEIEAKTVAGIAVAIKNGVGREEIEAILPIV